MGNLYFELIQEVEKLGILSLAQRKRLWKEFENFSDKNAVLGKNKPIYHIDRYIREFGFAIVRCVVESLADELEQA